MSAGRAFAIAPPTLSALADEWKPPCVCIDIETPATGEATLHKLAAFRPDTGASISFQGKFSPAQAKAKLDALAAGAEFVLGHNVRRHDLPVLAQLYPGLALADLPVIDTLELSPLAFPENPYHRLVKDYKLVSDARNHPLRDAELSLQLFREELQAFEALCHTRPDEAALFHFLLGAAPGGVGSFFALVRRAPCPSLHAAAGHLAKAVDGNVCSTRLKALVETDLSEASLHQPIAYLVAWLRVAGGNSVLPPWVHHTFPETGRLIRELRDVPCGSPECAYCRTVHDPEGLLARNFNLSAFRPKPQNDAGGSLQRDVTVAGLRGENLIAILPTGSGKSVCYQLPPRISTTHTSGTSANAPDLVGSLLLRSRRPRTESLETPLASRSSTEKPGACSSSDSRTRSIIVWSERPSSSWRACTDGATLDGGEAGSEAWRSGVLDLIEILVPRRFLADLDPSLPSSVSQGRASVPLWPGAFW